MNAAVAPTPITPASSELAEMFRKSLYRAVAAEGRCAKLLAAVRPLAALQLPEDKTDHPEDMLAAQRAFPDDLQIEDNDLPLTYGDVRAARLAYSPWGVHPDIWDRHMARRAVKS